MTVIVLSTLWPMRLWKKDVTLSVTPRSGTFSEYVDKDKIIRQTFLSQGTHLERMRLYIGEGSQGEFFYARMYDEKYQLVAEEEVQIPTEGLPCYVEMPMDLDMEKIKLTFSPCREWIWWQRQDRERKSVSVLPMNDCTG